MTDDIPLYGRRLKDMRTFRAFTQTHLARLVGTTDATIGRLERGESRNPSLLLYIKLAEALTCSLEYLAGVAAVPPWDRSASPPAQVQGGVIEGVEDGTQC